MTMMTYKQIAEALESGKAIKTTCNEWKEGRGYKHSYTVKVDGERFDVSAQSWGKLRKDLRAGRIEYVGVGSIYDLEREGKSDITVFENTIKATSR